jgi:hypothetical protein
VARKKGAAKAVSGLFKRFVSGFRRRDLPGSGKPHTPAPPKPSGPPRPRDPNFTPRPTHRDRHGKLTDGKYSVSGKANERHVKGTAPEGKSTFNEDVDTDDLSLTAAQYADDKNLWGGEIPGQPSSFSNKAKVPFDRDVGHHQATDQATNVVNVYRKKNGTVHISPGSRLD